MLQISKLWSWVSWPLVRAHACTLAIALTWNSTWRVPRDGFRHGPLAYGAVLTAALTLSTPVVLLQLAVGQLSQQDAVGIWRAVPFFRGVGYIRLLVSLAGAAYSMVYLALAVAYFLYTATHEVPFPDCVELLENEEEYVHVLNASECLRTTFMSPVRENPEYYIALSLITTVLWIASPFVFYSSVKLMKRIMYLLSPVILLLGVVVAACVGEGAGLGPFAEGRAWRGLAEPGVWAAAAVQALWSGQLAGGFLVAAGDSIYATTNVQWTSIAITVTNVISSWFWLVFWYLVPDGGEKETGGAAVLLLVYRAAEELPPAWTLVLYLTVILSGVISMLVLLYPVYDRLRRVGGVKWRLAGLACSVLGAGASLAALAGGLPVLALLEDLAVPLLVCTATVAEILALGLIYGWRNLVEDVEFLIGSELVKYWVWGWWAAPAVVAPVAAWWVTVVFLSHPGQGWAEVPEATALVVAAVVASVIFLICAAVAVARQVQYDLCEKLKSSFQPSRHWGPRDPITHYYWLARREDIDRGNRPRTRYNRRELGQFSHRISILTTSTQSKIDLKEVKQRSNSDDWLYTTGRREHIYRVDERKRSKSVDWDVPRKSLEVRSREPLSKEDGNNNVGFNFSVVVTK